VTLVTGATGNVGRELVGLLTDVGEPVRALTRNPASSAPQRMTRERTDT
jgi:uncharacterized protein YbjT (DUF2867 family)